MFSANTMLVLLLLVAVVGSILGVKTGARALFAYREKQEKLRQEQLKTEILEQELLNKTLSVEFQKRPQKQRD